MNADATGHRAGFRVGHPTRVGGQKKVKLGGQACPLRLGGHILDGQKPVKLGGQNPLELGGQKAAKLGGQNPPEKLGGHGNPTCVGHELVDTLGQVVVGNGCAAASSPPTLSWPPCWNTPGLITVAGLITMVGSNTMVGHGPTVGHPKFPEATGQRAGVRVGHPILVGHWSICALGGQIGPPRLGPHPGPQRLGAVGHIIGGLVGQMLLTLGHIIGGLVGHIIGGLVGQINVKLGHIAGDLVGHCDSILVGHTKGAMVGQVCGTKLGHTVAGMVIPPGHPGGRLGGAASDPKPCASPNGQSRVGCGQNSGTRVGQLNRVGQASIKLGHCTGDWVAIAPKPPGSTAIGQSTVWNWQIIVGQGCWVVT